MSFAPLAIADVLTAIQLILYFIIISIVLSHLEPFIRLLIWSIFNIVSWPFAFVSRAFWQLTPYVDGLVRDGLAGLAQEGTVKAAPQQEGERTWPGWYIVGPLVYFFLFLIFVFSDFSIAFLVFQAFGLVAAEAGSPLPVMLPLEFAIGILFVALGAFWGLLFFDLRGATPFAYIWSRIDGSLHRWLRLLAITCFVINLVAAFLMGLWRQWQLSAGQPEPWNSWVPPVVSGTIVLLVVAATAMSGKPLGSGLVAWWVLLLFAAGATSNALCTFLRLIVTGLRQLLLVPLAALSLLTALGRKLWNWLCSFEPLRRRLHLTTLSDPPALESLGGDLDTPVLGEGPATAGEMTASTDGQPRAGAAAPDPAAPAAPRAAATRVTPLADARPADAQPADAQPADAQPADAQPADAQPGTTAPSDAQPAPARSGLPR